MKSFKIQSAMEYLMTYGWAFLIIAVAVGALFTLVLPNIGGTGVSCISTPGFLCQTPVLGTNGNLSVTVGQSQGYTFYNVGLSCTATTSNTGLPNPISGMIYIFATGLASNTLAYPANTGFLSMVNGQTVTIPAGTGGLRCYQNGGIPFNSPPIGASFNGYIYINYTASSGAPGATNPMLTQKVGSISLHVV
ncbi:MAG: hypothetical protein ACREBF_02430 [Candidatus Micrarchaeales archaeon]